MWQRFAHSSKHASAARAIQPIHAKKTWWPSSPDLTSEKAIQPLEGCLCLCQHLFCAPAAAETSGHSATKNQGTAAKKYVTWSGMDLAQLHAEVQTDFDNLDVSKLSLHNQRLIANFCSRAIL